ncbi:Hypothetical predicted protein [Pelobates cultripes]|uniref:Uncharacterized protein n=1 Tax=Pelobates cultripes TaxID=61616 RepID=A0AAD1RUU1_PELCU|nr:Hypothetical predicted protein [Pelobates cultripes]
MSQAKNKPRLQDKGEKNTFFGTRQPQMKQAVSHESDQDGNGDDTLPLQKDPTRNLPVTLRDIAEGRLGFPDVHAYYKAAILHTVSQNHTPPLTTSMAQNRNLLGPTNIDPYIPMDPRVKKGILYSTYSPHPNY